MTEYLSYKYNDSEEFVSTFDELPFWSASFGLLLFKHLELKPNLTVTEVVFKECYPQEELFEILVLLEQNLNLYAERNDGLTLTVPMAFIEGEKL